MILLTWYARTKRRPAPKNIIRTAIQACQPYVWAIATLTWVFLGYYYNNYWRTNTRCIALATVDLLPNLGCHTPLSSNTRTKGRTRKEDRKHKTIPKLNNVDQLA